MQDGVFEAALRRVLNKDDYLRRPTPEFSAKAKSSVIPGRDAKVNLLART